MDTNEPIKHIKRVIWLDICPHIASAIVGICCVCPAHLASSQKLIAGNQQATLVHYLILVMANDIFSQTLVVGLKVSLKWASIKILHPISIGFDILRLSC